MRGTDVVAQEIHLVSEKWKFGGTPDAILRVDGKLVLADWKTSQRHLPRHVLLQLAAYRHLIEYHPEETLEAFRLPI